MTIRTGTIAVICVLFIAGFGLAADETGKVTSITGKVSLQAGGKGPAKALKMGDAVRQGDVLTLGAGSKLTLSFSDGSTMDVAGPARFGLRLVADYARTIELYSGSINRLTVKGITTGVTTPLDAFVVLKNGVASVKLDSTPSKNRATFKLWEGTQAKVFDGSSTKIMKTDRAVIIERTRSVAPPTRPAAAPTVKGESSYLTLGSHKVELNPKSYFKVEPTSDGGAIVTSLAPEGQFGRVVIDNDVTFYLARDESIEFDGNGNVVRHNGIVHVYASLDVRGIYDEAVADPSDSSPTGRNSGGSSSGSGGGDF